MTNDQQTHEIPFDEIKLKKLANFSGYKSLESFSEELGHVLELVEAHYSNLFDKTSDLAENGSLVFTGLKTTPTHCKLYPIWVLRNQRKFVG